MIPTHQDLMRPVLELALDNEVRIRDAVETLADEFDLTEEERAELLPSGKQSRFANRVHWAKSYLNQAGLVELTRRGFFVASELGRKVASDREQKIDTEFLQSFDDFQDFKQRSRQTPVGSSEISGESQQELTPDEALRSAHKAINEALGAELLSKVQGASPRFFEEMIVDLLILMGYGGSADDPGRAIGKSGDDGVDGLIDQDPLGVDQIFIQAKRYQTGNVIGAGHIRDFFGALNLKRATKGIFFTTSSFSNQAVETAGNLSNRIVLIDGRALSRLMLRYGVGCRTEEILELRKLDADFFDETD